MDDFWRKETKLEWFRDNPLTSISFERITPSKQHNWLNLADTDFETLIPLADKNVKLGKREEGVYKLFSLGVATNRDEWAYDFGEANLESRMKYFTKVYEQKRKSFFAKTENERKELLEDEKNFNDFIGSEIKFTRELIHRDFLKNKEIKFKDIKIVTSSFRPFVKKFNYFDSEHRITHEPYQNPQIWGKFGTNKNTCICLNTSGKDFRVLATKFLPDLHFIGDSQCLPLYRYGSNNTRHDNITIWGLQQFREHYNDKRITREDIFHYTYGVLHHPAYRRKYELNLKREFPRLPFYEDFRQWKAWGKELMDLHINYETAKPFALKRIGVQSTAFRRQSLSQNATPPEGGTLNIKPRAKLKADKLHGTIELDTETTLHGVPPLAWEYKLGNRSALEWILDQYKEKKPSDATIAEKFNTYRFADYKEQVIGLLKRVCTVSIKTMEIINQMPD
jgi:predicted helicase